MIKAFGEFYHCWDNSGFVRDEKKYIPIAPNAVWEDYIGVRIIYPFYFPYIIWYYNRHIRKQRISAQ